MYFCFTYRTIYHVVEEPQSPGYRRTLCGLACVNGRTVAERPGFLRLCKRCAKWLPREEKPAGE